jgi:hypothetical protein
VTKEWAKQRSAELRHASAEATRREKLLKEQSRPEKREAPEPTGVLAEKISAAASELGVSIDALLVMSHGNDPYTAWRRRPEAEWFARLFDRFVAAGATKHLRGFFYLLVSSPDRIMGPDGKPFVNDYKHWQALQSASKAARWLQLISFERIVDERNAPPSSRSLPASIPARDARSPKPQKQFYRGSSSQDLADGKRIASSSTARNPRCRWCCARSPRRSVPR